MELSLYAKFFVQEKVSSGLAREFIISTKEKIRQGKIFVVTTGSFETDESLKSDDNVSLLNGRSFVNYLHQFKLV